MRKLLKSGLIILLSLSFVLAGCSSNSSSSADSESASGSPVELSLWSFVPVHLDFYEDAEKRWNEANPDKQIQLKTESYPFDQHHNNLLMALQSGVGAPDIVDISVKRFSDYLKGNVQLLPLNDIVDPVRDSFIESRLEIYAKDGTNYGLPTHLGAAVMFYNKEILDEAGVDVDEIETWDDFIEKGKQVVDETGKPMMTVEASDLFTFWPMITQQKSDFFNENGEVTLDNETNIETLQTIRDMVYTDKIAEVAPGGSHHAEEYYSFMAKSGAAAVQMPMWYMSRFIDYMPELSNKILIRPLPSWEEGGFRSAGMGGTGTAVTNQTEHEELALEFLEFAKTTKESNIQLWNILGFVPPRHDVWESEEIVNGDNKYFDYFGEGIFDTVEEVKDEIYPVNITGQSSQVTELLNTQVFYEVLLQDSQDAAEALKQAADELRDTN